MSGHWIIKAEVFEENPPETGEGFQEWETRVVSYVSTRYGERGSDWHFGTIPEVWWDENCEKKETKN